jgi:hypothetical protein
MGKKLLRGDVHQPIILAAMDAQRRGAANSACWSSE